MCSIAIWLERVRMERERKVVDMKNKISQGCSDKYNKKTILKVILIG